MHVYVRVPCILALNNCMRTGRSVRDTHELGHSASMQFTLTPDRDQSASASSLFQCEVTGPYCLLMYQAWAHGIRTLRPQLGRASGG